MRLHIYPVMIILDRYGGTYSGAKWTAFNAYGIPAGAQGDDLSCCDFWSDPKMPFGLGATPDGALLSLEASVARWNKTDDCPNWLLPDGPKCPRCGGRRGPSGVDGGSWVHY